MLVTWCSFRSESSVASLGQWLWWLLHCGQRSHCPLRESSHCPLHCRERSHCSLHCSRTYCRCSNLRGKGAYLFKKAGFMYRNQYRGQSFILYVLCLITQILSCILASWADLILTAARRAARLTSRDITDMMSTDLILTAARRAPRRRRQERWTRWRRRQSTFWRSLIIVHFSLVCQ